MTLCKYCDNPIYFDQEITSKNGKLIPLQEWDNEPHNCPMSPYKSQFPKVRAKDENQIVDTAKAYIQYINDKLISYSLNLIVSGRGEI